mmetsp:Transcript_152405/g.488843  ORF Transcript_152405/g.488843 Transcript_152405/m.488843 type:complete len:208 (-) Transcript_152405:20-643(-)
MLVLRRVHQTGHAYAITKRFFVFSTSWSTSSIRFSKARRLSFCAPTSFAQSKPSEALQSKSLITLSSLRASSGWASAAMADKRWLASLTWPSHLLTSSEPSTPAGAININVTTLTPMTSFVPRGPAASNTLTSLPKATPTHFRPAQISCCTSCATDSCLSMASRSSPIVRSGLSKSSSCLSLLWWIDTLIPDIPRIVSQRDNARRRL